MEIRPLHLLPPKSGLSSPEGQARLAHDLASIELQATELAVRTILEFADAPAPFRAQLAELARSEGNHLRLCLRALEQLGFEFGDWPVHLGLWQAVGGEDSLIDRVIIVHRYLEGAGLDASESILVRLSVARDASAVREAVSVIAREEVGHVEFGSRWLRKLCEQEGLSAEEEFERRIERLMRVVPRRERLARDARMRAGFSPRELDAIARAQAARIQSPNTRPPKTRSPANVP